MVEVRLSAQTIHGMGDGSDIGKIEGLMLRKHLVSLEGSMYGTIYTYGNLEGSYLGS